MNHRRRRVILRKSFPLPDKVKEATLPMSDAQLVESIQLLWCQGRDDNFIRYTLGLSQPRWLELVGLIKTADPNPSTAERAFEELCDEYEKFRTRIESTMGELTRLLEFTSKRDPIWDYPLDLRASRRVLRDMAELNTRLMKGRMELLAAKVRLNLVAIPRESPLPLPGRPLFAGTNVRLAWELRERKLLTNGSQN
jgi:hypothetical protein